MKIENGKVVPCSTCLKARLLARDVAKALTGRTAKTQLIECAHADIVVENNIVTMVKSEGDFAGLVGRKVIVGGKRLFDVGFARPVAGVGPVLKVGPVADPVP